MRIILANLSGQPRRVSVQGLGEQIRFWCMDEKNVLEAMQSPEAYRALESETRRTEAGTLEVDLLPYAVVRIDASG